MYYVYLIKSKKNSEETYIGITSNLAQRLETHNSGGSIFTQKNRPWEIILYIAFKDKTRAGDFEHYLKSASGKAFAKKRFW